MNEEPYLFTNGRKRYELNREVFEAVGDWMRLHRMTDREASEAWYYSEPGSDEELEAFEMMLEELDDRPFNMIEDKYPEAVVDWGYKR